MSRFFINIYDWFDKHKVVFYTVLVLLVSVCALLATQISLQENITNFFNSTDEKKNATFENVAVKDKIIVMLNGEDPESIIASAETFEAEITPLIDGGLISSVTAYADEEMIGKCTRFIYDNLPIFLTDEDFVNLENKVTEDGIRKSVEKAYNLQISPSGMFIGDVIMQDPLNIGTHLLDRKSVV